MPTNAARSRVLLHENRWITLVLDGEQEVDLRPPTVTEWGKILRAYAVAQAVVAEAASSDGSVVRTLYGLGPIESDATEEPLEPAPYAVALSKVIDLLSRTKVDAGELPMWAGQSLMQVLYDHWRSVDIVEDADAPVTSPAADSATVGADAPWVAREGSDLPIFDLEAAVASANGSDSSSSVGGMPASQPGVLVEG